MNTLYYGDNLDLLKSGAIPEDSVDLIYLDPPFNSQANYNVLFRSPTGDYARAQRDAFEDTWRWDKKALAAFEAVLAIGGRPARILSSFRVFLGDNDTMAYLCMMTVRLIELRRVLRDSGSLYLHCDPTASHYLKLILDAVFNPDNFRNEIVWHYRKWSTGKYTFQRNHDVILFYSKSESKKRVFNQLFMERSASTLRRFGNKRIISGYDDDGKRVPAQMADEDSLGVRMDDVWAIGRVPPIKQIFPTQKPDALLERIITASSNEGDVVLDPFCGCGTAIVTADRLKRKWIGIDIAYEAMMIIEARLKSMRPAIARRKDYILKGQPTDMVGARALARDDPYAFQAWAMSLLRGGQPHGRKEDLKKGKDRGVDGLVYFRTGAESTGFAVVSVKGTEKVHPDMIRDLRGTMIREGAKLGIFVSLAPHTRDMRAEAASRSPVEIAGRGYPEVQLLTIEELLDDRRPDLPPVFDLATLLTLPRALPVMRKESPEKLRRQINLLLPMRGGGQRGSTAELFGDALASSDAGRRRARRVG